MPNDSSAEQKISHDPAAPGESMCYSRWYDEPPQIILDYLDGDISSTPQQRNKKAFYKDFKLFGRGIKEVLASDLARAAYYILYSEKQEDVEALLELVTNKPMLMYVEIEAKDPLGRVVRGTLLQIALMAGDMDAREIKGEGLYENKKPDKTMHGIVERLMMTSLLSKQEIAEQLTCLTSKEAKEANDKRKQQVLSAVVRFGEAVLQTVRARGAEEDYNTVLERYRKDHTQPRCISEYVTDYKKTFQPLIEQFEKDLQSDVVITMGYIFDSSILYDVISWIKENLSRMDNHIQEEILATRCIGMLQKKLSVRDAQIISYPCYLTGYPPRVDMTPFYDDTGIGIHHFLFAYENKDKYGGGIQATKLPHLIYGEARATDLQKYYFNLKSRKEHSLEKIISEVLPEKSLIKNFLHKFHL